jgi:hypothetical protein
VSYFYLEEVPGDTRNRNELPKRDGARTEDGTKHYGWPQDDTERKYIPHPAHDSAAKAATFSKLRL